ncbi:MAG: Lrp/AsnC family transcriptional regulator [Gammaproteobacteria bacterium]|nr:MAG: Lrp/AsnC family transcriptional regulator [Gammaproteobacteria bacterium]
MDLKAHRHPGLDDPRQRALLREIEGGLPLVSRPYAVLAARLGMTEAEVLSHLRRMLASGVLKRIGIVVRHRRLGYQANAMVVWDVPDDQVDRIGRLLGRAPWVTLCYRRPRRPPAWPYNLFTMIHGRDREAVRHNIERLVQDFGLHAIRREVLFSRRSFRQRGARYFSLAPRTACPREGGTAAPGGGP